MLREVRGDLDDPDPLEALLAQAGGDRCRALAGPADDDDGPGLVLLQLAGRVLEDRFGHAQGVDDVTAVELALPAHVDDHGFLVPDEADGLHGRHAVGGLGATGDEGPRERGDDAAEGDRQPGVIAEEFDELARFHA